MSNTDKFFVRYVQESLFGSLVWTLATAAILAIIGRPILMILSVIGLFFLFVAIKGVAALRRRLTTMREVGPRVNALNVPRRGVIFTLSLRSGDRGSVVYQVVNSLRAIDQNLKPEWFGFLGTAETDQAGIVDALCRDLNIPRANVKSETSDPTAVHEGKARTSIIIDWMLRHGLKESEIVLDLTGGTATMSVAAFMAADEKQIDSQYIYSEFDKKTNQIKPSSQKQILVTRYMPSLDQ